jgi:predicted metal-binding protein
MKKIGIIICHRYHRCAGGKCLRAVRERAGAFSIYPKDEELVVVGYTSCAGCPGGNIEYAPAEMIKNGAEAIHLATGLVVGYPPCPSIRKFKEFIESRYNVPVIVGTHPIPMNYMKEHEKLPFWGSGMRELAKELFKDSEEMMKSYD